MVTLIKNRCIHAVNNYLKYAYRNWNEVLIDQQKRTRVETAEHLFIYVFIQNFIAHMYNYIHIRHIVSEYVSHTTTKWEALTSYWWILTVILLLHIIITIIIYSCDKGILWFTRMYIYLSVIIIPTGEGSYSPNPCHRYVNPKQLLNGTRNMSKSYFLFLWQGLTRGSPCLS